MSTALDEASLPTGPVLVTGTDTGVGKTVVTAVLAAAAAAAGLKVAVLKPAQTGDDSDEDEIRRLAAPETTRTLAAYPDPLAPLVAAQQAGMPELTLERTVAAARELADCHDLVLMEGAGGLLVPMGVRAGPGGNHPPAHADPETSEWTVVDLALELAAPAVVVTRAGLGTLNHTALALEALRHRGIPAQVVIGAWPTRPEMVHSTNLERLRPHLLGVVPERAAELSPSRFQALSVSWLRISAST